MEISRRSFLGGAASFGALAFGGRAFAAPAGLLSGAGANLTLGVISDIHVGEGRGDFRKFGDAAQFERTLRWFDEQGVDGVIRSSRRTRSSPSRARRRAGSSRFPAQDGSYLCPDEVYDKTVTVRS